MTDTSNDSSPLVSVVTVNYGHSEVTCDMLATLFRISYPSIQVIVVDNHAPGDNARVIKEQYPQILLIEAGENLGFAGANNLGIEHAHGDFILLLNNDTEVSEGFLEPLIDKMRSDPQIGAVSPKIKYYYSPDTIQYAGLTPINSYTIRSRSIGFAEKDDGRYQTDTITAYAHGAAMLISRTALKSIGLMSTAFFLYYEELDWGFRLRKAGYKIYFVHNSVVYHKESVSTGKMSPLKTYYLNRSRWLYMRRNVYGFTYLISILFQCLIAIPKNITQYLIKGRFDLLKAYLRALWWHIKNAFNENIYAHPYLKT